MQYGFFFSPDYVKHALSFPPIIACPTEERFKNTLLPFSASGHCSNQNPQTGWLSSVQTCKLNPTEIQCVVGPSRHKHLRGFFKSSGSTTITSFSATHTVSMAKRCLQCSTGQQLHTPLSHPCHTAPVWVPVRVTDLVVPASHTIGSSCQWPHSGETNCLTAHSASSLPIFPKQLKTVLLPNFLCAKTNK